MWPCWIFGQECLMIHMAHSQVGIPVTLTHAHGLMFFVLMVMFKSCKSIALCFSLCKQMYRTKFYPYNVAYISRTNMNCDVFCLFFVEGISTGYLWKVYWHLRLGTLLIWDICKCYSVFFASLVGLLFFLQLCPIIKLLYVWVIM